MNIHSFLRGGIWLLTAQGLTIVISTVGTMIFAHMLSAADFGVYRYIMSLGVLFGSFALTGAGQAILQAASKKDLWYYRHATATTTLYSLAASALALLGAVWYLYQGNSTLAFGCFLVALLQPSSQYFLNALAFLHGQQKFKAATTLQTFRSLIITGLSLLTLWFTTDILILIAVYLGAQSCTGIASLLLTRYSRTRSPDESTSTVRNYDQIAIHTSIRNILVGIAMRLDNIIVFQQLGAVSLATFTIATLLPDHIKGAFKNLPTLLIPRFANREAAHTPNFRQRAFQGFLLLSLISGITIISTPFLYGVLFPSYPEAVLYTQLLALSFPASVYHIYSSWHQAQAYERELYYSNIFTSVCQLIITFIAVIFFGLLGAICARIATQYLQLIVVWAIHKKHTLALSQDDKIS